MYVNVSGQDGIRTERKDDVLPVYRSTIERWYEDLQVIDGTEWGRGVKEIDG